jgi:hypothetical protein
MGHHAGAPFDRRAFIAQVAQAEPLSMPTVALDELQRRDGRMYDKADIAATYQQLLDGKDTPADRELLAAASPRLVRAAVDAAAWQAQDIREIAQDLRTHGRAARSFYGCLRPAHYQQALAPIDGPASVRARPREHRPRRRAGASSRTSSSDPGDAEPPAAEPWRWAHPYAAWDPDGVATVAEWGGLSR